MDKIELPVPDLDFLFHISRETGESYRTGNHSIVPVTGMFEGPELKGRILDGGADWITDEHGAKHLNSKYILKTDDGAVISMQLKGWEVPGATRAHLFFTASKKYKWLNGIVALACSAQNGGLDAYSVR